MSKQIPTFRIYDKNKKKIQTLIHCFVKVVALTKDDYCALQGFNFAGRFYELVWDESVHLPLAELEGKDSILCAVSLQEHSYGRFAIVKPARDTETQETDRNRSISCSSSS